MYKLILNKKISKEPIFIGDDEGMKIKKIWMDDEVYKFDHIISLKSIDITFKKKDIDFIGKEVESKAVTNKDIEDKEKITRQEYLHWRDKTPKEKSLRPGLLKLFKLAFVDWTQDHEDMLTTDLEKFFKKNPKRTYGDSPIYLKYLKDRTPKTISTKTAISLATAAIGLDMSNARYIK